MAIQLESTAVRGSGDGIAPLLLEKKGAQFRGLLIDTEPKQENEYLKEKERAAGKVARPMWWKDRQPTPMETDAAMALGLDKVMFDIITLSAIKAGPNVSTGGDVPQAPSPGDLVKLFAHGPRGRGWRDALDGRGKPTVGEVVLITWVDTDEDSGKQTWTFTFEESTPEQVAEAERIHKEIKAGQRISLPSSAAPMTAEDVADAFGADSDPF